MYTQYTFINKTRPKLCRVSYLLPSKNYQCTILGIDQTDTNVSRKIYRAADIRITVAAIKRHPFDRRYYNAFSRAIAG